jgi:hypothetical protein
MHEYLNNIREQMKPKYHELTAYLTALTCAVLFVMHSEFRQVYFEIISGAGADNRASFSFMALGLLATIGFFLSFIHVFIKRKKSVFEKACMGIFIMGANGMAGIMAGIEMIPLRWSIVAIIPAWNIFMGAILLYQIGLAKFDVTDENTSLFEVLIASFTMLIVFVVVDFGFRLKWAMAFSICMFYSSTILFFITWMINFIRFRTLAKT